MRPVFVFLIAFVLLSGFFYFYPAEIFQAKIKGGLAEITADVSLQTLLFKSNVPAGLNEAQVDSIKPTMQGILILIACLIGLPALLALRFGKKQTN